MRRSAALAAPVTLLALLVGCSDDDPAGDGAAARADATSSPTPAPSDPGTPSGGDDGAPSQDAAPAPGDPDAAVPGACRQVVLGIDAFNLGDYEETVRRFEQAVPLAREAVDDDPTTEAADLLEAVEYYAELAPGDYLEAAATSPDFARYKEITLGQCAAAGAGRPVQSEPPGQLA